jgi:hypothetical protein
MLLGKSFLDVNWACQVLSTEQPCNAPSPVNFQARDSARNTDKSTEQQDPVESGGTMQVVEETKQDWAGLANRFLLPCQHLSNLACWSKYTYMYLQTFSRTCIRLKQKHTWSALLPISLFHHATTTGIDLAVAKSRRRSPHSLVWRRASLAASTQLHPASNNATL